MVIGKGVLTAAKAITNANGYENAGDEKDENAESGDEIVKAKAAQRTASEAYAAY